MQKKVQYITETERQNIINENLSLYLLEEQNITEGNFLIFTDVKPIENQLTELNDNQLTIMSAIADLYSALPKAQEA